MTPKSYKDNFFSHHLQMSISSAEEIIPLIQEYVNPASVIDVGCGIGTWLSVWKKRGVSDVLGVDGDYVSKQELLIDEPKFISTDLEKGYKSNRQFDLVSCLEVAEHINAASAERLIHSLCSLGDIVLFSAAIPGQEGTLHVNEQYPSYWIKIFQNNNFVPIDCIRKKIWSNEKIAFWYRQNIIIYVNKAVLQQFEKLQLEANNTDLNFIDIVHPGYFNYKSGKVIDYEKFMGSPKRMMAKALKTFFKNR
jgi:hypothetical protein